LRGADESGGEGISELSPLRRFTRFENAHPDIYDRMLLAVAGVERRVLLTREVTLFALGSKARLPVAEA
jgi:hypothetical protein